MSTKPAIALRREPGPLIRSLVALTLRIGLGLIFLMAGLGKFEARKAGKYPAMIVTQFADTPLRPELIRLFADVLPYAEVALGTLLTAGTLAGAHAAAMYTAIDLNPSGVISSQATGVSDGQQVGLVRPERGQRRQHANQPRRYDD